MNITAKIHNASEETQASRKKMLPYSDVGQILEGKDVVLTKGVFDLMHMGHLRLLSYCGKLKRSLNNGVLVVALPTDRIVRQKKGVARPINPEQTRLAQIAALDVVDHVVLFDEHYPVELIKQSKPRYYVKGQDTAKAQGICFAGNEVEISLSRSNPEVEVLFQYAVQMVVYCDDGEISTTDLINGILKKHSKENSGSE